MREYLRSGKGPGTAGTVAKNKTPGCRDSGVMVEGKIEILVWKSLKGRVVAFDPMCWYVLTCVPLSSFFRANFSRLVVMR